MHHPGTGKMYQRTDMGKKMERIEKKMAKKIKYEKTVIEGVKDVPVKDIASESYFQTVLRRFKRHHLAVASLAVVAVLGGAALLAPVIAPISRMRLWALSAVPPVRNSGWERTRLDGMCSADFCTPCGYPCWWELWQP